MHAIREKEFMIYVKKNPWWSLKEEFLESCGKLSIKERVKELMINVRKMAFDTYGVESECKKKSIKEK